jgi:type II secretory pathway pseudopilin PulG
LSNPTSKCAAESGFATVTAIILCAVVSIVCAGVLGLTLTKKRLAERQLFQMQRSEAANTAILQFGTEIIRAQGDATITKEQVISWSGGHVTVALRAEYEGRKWPVSKVGEVGEAVLGKYTSLTKGEIAQLAGTGQAMAKNDCVRTLFSTYGNTDPKKEFPTGIGLIASAGGHDGQVWRIRAVTAGTVDERYVRFTGDSAHLFGIVSEEDFAKSQMLDCPAMRVAP